MNDYDRYDFYSRMDETTGTRHYYLKVNHKFIRVSKEVYNLCYNSYRKQLRDGVRDHDNGLTSYDKVLDDGKTLLDYLGKEEDIIEKMDIRDRLQKVLKAINDLDPDDKRLIMELLIFEKKEKELAKEYHVTQQMINKRKHIVLKKIKNKIDMEK